MDMGASGLGDLAGGGGGGSSGGFDPFGGAPSGSGAGSGGGDPFGGDPQLSGMDSGGGFGNSGGFPGGGSSMPGGGSSPATNAGTQNDPSAIAPTAMSTASSQPATQVGSSAPGAGTQAKGGGGGGLPSQLQQLLQGGQKGGDQGGGSGSHLESEMQQIASTLLGRPPEEEAGTGAPQRFAQADTGSMTDASDPGVRMMPPGSDKSPGPTCAVQCLDQEQRLGRAEPSGPVLWRSSSWSTGRRPDGRHQRPAAANGRRSAGWRSDGRHRRPAASCSKPSRRTRPPSNRKSRPPPSRKLRRARRPRPAATRAPVRPEQPMNLFKVLAEPITKGPISLFQNLPQLMQQLGGQGGFPNPLGFPQAGNQPTRPQGDLPPNRTGTASVPPQSGPASGQNKDPNAPGISDAEKQNRIRARDLPPGWDLHHRRQGAPRPGRARESVPTPLRSKNSRCVPW